VELEHQRTEKRQEEHRLIRDRQCVVNLVSIRLEVGQHEHVEHCQDHDYNQLHESTRLKEAGKAGEKALSYALNDLPGSW
jgi:hypothetical protein